MPQFSPMSWSLLSMFLMAVLVLAMIEIWWKGGVIYKVGGAVMEGNVEFEVCSRLFGWNGV
uniref:ATP synthase F0 subunit 8 n=1 Tax=Chamberlainia hainesiana TaxID=1264661 RepID=A0A513X0A7_9BIVA|nr:ATP synthase F0 subunit 8 [Chamberlainia hainesiana]